MASKKLPIGTSNFRQLRKEGLYYVDKSLLGEALKDNDNLQKAIVTGILRVAKESLFSGLNNLTVATVPQAPPQPK